MAITALSPGQYGKLVDEIAALIDQDVSVVHRKIAFDLFRGVVLKTPVDTGRARASWKVGIGEIDTSVAGLGPQQDAAGVTAEGEEVIGTMDKPVHTWITNSLPYIGALEDGHSKQAPNGMVALTAAEVKADIGKLLG